jgi:hypothetical protein
MKNCKFCGAIPREYRDQKQATNFGNSFCDEEKIFHIVECSKGCHRVVSFKSITNARNLWKKQNIVTKQDMYDEIVNILGHYFDNETLEKVRLTFKQYEAKL